LNTVSRFRAARSRADLRLAPGEAFVAGGTWLFSEPQLSTTGLVDLTTLGWSALEYSPDGLRVAATCTIAELARLPERPGWRAQPLFAQCANALLASFKIWNLATVGGNICRSFAAASMVSLSVALDASALIWTPDGGEYRVPVEKLITGDGTNALRAGEVLRAVDLPDSALRSRTAFRKIALASLGRSGAVLTGRVDDDGSVVLAITAATRRPTVLRYPEPPDPAVLRRDVDAVEGYYTDPLGTADWRRQVSGVLLEEIRAELAG
jgi:CO/xanthine dehydrogenase FAD-binding subunit